VVEGYTDSSMDDQSVKEKIKMWRIQALPQLDLMRATYVQQHFAKHTHEGFAVGVIENGALGFFYRGENVVAARGAINLANPDEAHTGHAAVPEGWTYRMFYLHADMLKKAACQIAGRNVQMPFFQSGVIQDDWLADIIRRIHLSLEEETNPILEKGSLLLMMLSQLIQRHSDAPPPLFALGNEKSSVRRAREYIDANCSEDISIDSLAAVAHLSPYHFIRVFHKEMGLPPHRYLKQARVRRAKELLSRGWSIAAAALEAGFVDQSHLSRNFKHILGFTPGQFSNFIQYGRKHPPA
jgi:AraC-like DNA-binding protein